MREEQALVAFRKIKIKTRQYSFRYMECQRPTGQTTLNPKNKKTNSLPKRTIHLILKIVHGPFEHIHPIGQELIDLN